MKKVLIGMALLMMPLNANEGQIVGNLESCESGYRAISTLELNQLIYTSRSPFAIIDARLAEEDDGRRIADAKFLPLETDAKVIKAIIPNLKVKVVVYSMHVDCPNSAKMAVRLAKMGYSHVFQYGEGIDGWEKSGNKVERVRKVGIRPPQIKPLLVDTP
ncbi:rhodanese-like domain-containing protein [Candidatus Protochlamydia naegleriophila]|nr:rhodanese-like domain-containing protein [Candidatus Protochlamydia naegleriophila]